MKSVSRAIARELDKPGSKAIASPPVVISSGETVVPPKSSNSVVPNKGANRVRRRALYNRVMRDERKYLSKLEKVSLPGGLDRRTYRTVRRIYYCILPSLAQRLTAEFDRIRIEYVGLSIENWLVRYNIRRGCLGARIRAFRTFPANDPTLQQ